MAEGECDRWSAGVESALMKMTLKDGNADARIGSLQHWREKKEEEKREEDCEKRRGKNECG